MEKAEFTEHLIGLSTEKLCAFNCLAEETAHYWGEICDGRFEWQSYRDEAICLRAVSKDDVLSAFDQWLRPGQPRCMAVFEVIGNGDGSVSGGRPAVESGDWSGYHDSQLQLFHRKCKGQTWGRINSKLF